MVGARRRGRSGKQTLKNKPALGDAEQQKAVEERARFDMAREWGQRNWHLAFMPLPSLLIVTVTPSRHRHS